MGLLFSEGLTFGQAALGKEILDGLAQKEPRATHQEVTGDRGQRRSL